MSEPETQTVFWQAGWMILALPVIFTMTGSTAGMAETLSLEAVKERLRERDEKVDCLYLRIRRVRTVLVDPKVLLNCPTRLALPEHLGSDEVLIAFKADKRYRRVKAERSVRVFIGSQCTGT